MRTPSPAVQKLERDTNSSNPSARTYSAGHLRLVGDEGSIQNAPSRSYQVIDGSVIERAVSGDEAAFTEMVRWYHPRFLRFAHNMLQSTNDADDAVQDAFIRVYRALPLYRECDRFESWLFRILANCCRTLLAKRKRMGTRHVSLDSVEALGIHTKTDSGDDLAWGSMLSVALNSLPVEQREAFLLHHVDGHSYETMAEMTGLGQSALKMRVKRACDKLKLMLSGVVDE